MPKTLTMVLRAYFRLLQILATALMGLMIVPVTLQIVSRYTGLIPRYIWTEEAARFCFVWIIMLGAMIAVRDFEVDLLPTPKSARGEAVMRLIVSLLMLVFAAMFVTYGWRYAAFGYTQGESVLVLRASPDSGVSPLSVSFTLSSLVSIAQMSVDIDGDGSTDFQGSSLDGQTFSYEGAGAYLARASVTDTSGAIHSATTLVRVYDLSVLDGILQAKWQGLKDALLRGDIEAALRYVATSARARYRSEFSALMADLPSIDTILTDLMPIEVWGRHAVYGMQRTDDGIEKTFEVRFVIDTDGIWRLSMF